MPHQPAGLDGERFDTVICLNVLEQIEDDAGSLAAMKAVLEPLGKVALLVPALPALYGTLDRELGHFRRYTRTGLRKLFHDASLSLTHMEYFNLAGVPGWWLTGRVLRRDLIPTGPLAVYEMLVPLFRLETLLPWRFGQSLIAIGERGS